MIQETKKAYQEKLEAQIAEWDADLSKLKAKAEGAKAEGKIEYYKQVEELEAKRDEVKSKLNQLQDAGEETWEDLKSGIEDSWNALTDGLKNAWEKLGQ